MGFRISPLGYLEKKLRENSQARALHRKCKRALKEKTSPHGVKGKLID